MVVKNSYKETLSLPTHYRILCHFVVVLMLALFSTAVWAIQPPKNASSPLAQKRFAKPELQVSFASEPLKNVRHLMSPVRSNAHNRFAGKYGQDFHFHIDPRSGTPTNIVGHIPLIPGSGKNNHISKVQLSQKLGRTIATVDADTVSLLLKNFLQENQDVMSLDVAQVGMVRSEQVSDHLWQTQVMQEVNGIKVRGARLAATISHGNLVMFGTERWGKVRIDTTPVITAKEAMTVGFKYADGQLEGDIVTGKPILEIVPIAPQGLQDGDRYTGLMGGGYDHRLVWTFSFKRPPEAANWEIMIDARTGEVLSFKDLNHYAQSGITGGVYPLTSTEICPVNTCCGAMQAGQPMPFADTGQPSPNNFTNSAGLFDYESGTVTTTLAGKYVRINDSCGAVSETVPGSSGLNLGGTNSQHDCISGGTSPGNTAAARSSYYEINRMQEMARSLLPNNVWLQSRLTTNVNVPVTSADNCNAYWDETDGSVNFYKSGYGCRNAGELAGIFDHEWGHGLDFNDGNGYSNPSESYADIAAMYRTQLSCMGYGFFSTYDMGCGQTSDGTGTNTDIAQLGTARCALNCSGVRETDWDQLTNPAHTPDTPQNFVCSKCSVDVYYGYNGPCGKEAHCESAVDTEAAWDFVARDLQSPPFSYDANTSFIIANRIFYQAAGNIGAWHTCSCASSTSNGCGATNAYMQWLAADDDDGDINNGTPHMTALYNAFNRHGIACDTPTPVDSGCAGAPAATPMLTATPGNNQVGLSWPADTTATGYSVYRTEGVAGCETGKTLIATVTDAAAYADLNLANDRQYCYSVTSVGTSKACFSPASVCVCATPALGPHGALQGTITSSATGSPISGVRVTTTGGYSTITDSAGLYQLANMLPGTYDVTVAEAYSYQLQAATGVEISDSGTAIQDFQLASLPTATVQGTVNDGSGHGWPLYATIAITAAGYTGTVHTDPITGQYNVSLPAGISHTFTVNSFGYNPGTRSVTPASEGSVEDFVVTVAATCSAPGYQGSIYEQFESGALPTGWTSTRYSPSNSIFWSFNDPGGRGNLTGGSGKFAIIDSDNAGRDKAINTALITPALNFTGISTVPLEFDTDYRRYSSDVADVDVSNNGGSTWTNVWRKSGASYRGPKHEYIDISALAANQANVMVRFHYTGNYDWWWEIDNVKVGNSCLPIAGGLLAGNVYGADTGAGLNSASVTNGAGQSTSSAATPADPALDDGFYRLFLPVGANDLTVSASPYQPGTASLIIAGDSVSRQNFTLNLFPLTITTGTLPYAITSTVYNQTMSATGGRTPYAWTITSGALPAGLSQNSATGVISGTPSETGTFSFTVQTTDFISNTVSKALTIAVYAPLSVTTATLPFAVTDTVYNRSLSASGGLAPYTWAITSGSLPADLSLDASTGVISGTSSTTGTFSFTVRATDANATTATASLTLDIYPPVSLATSTLAPATAATTYSQTLTASGGSGSYIWTITSGTLPAGLTLNSATGVISGTPSLNGDYSFLVRAVSGASSDAKQFTLTVNVAAIRVPGVTTRFFNLLQSAYDNLSDGETMELHGADFTENLDFKRNVTVVLKGGYANDYGSIVSVTNIHGTVTIRQGTVIIENLVLMP